MVTTNLVHYGDNHLVHYCDNQPWTWCDNHLVHYGDNQLCTLWWQPTLYTNVWQPTLYSEIRRSSSRIFDSHCPALITSLMLELGVDDIYTLYTISRCLLIWVKSINYKGNFQMQNTWKVQRELLNAKYMESTKGTLNAKY